DGLEEGARPVNWSFSRKWAIVGSTSLATFVVSFGSSVYSAAIPQIQAKFSVSRDTALLGITLYVLGFAFGPMVWGPASELYGKSRPLWIGYFIFCVCQLPCALAEDFALLLTFRFLSGLAGSSTLAILGGMYVDFLTDPVERGISTAVFSVATFCGPTVGPILGNLAAVRLGWRWTAWLTLMGGIFFGTVAFLLTPETSEVVILRRKSRKAVSRSGSSEDVLSRTRRTESGVSVFLRNYLTKPTRMFVREPILVFFTIYMSLAYGVIYISLTMYPLAFVTSRGWSRIDGSLPFLGIVIGVILACIAIAMHSIFYVSPRLEETGIHLPERRLPPMIAGSVILSAGIFWFGWASNPSTPWPAQVPAGVLIGCGSILVLMSGVVYLIEVYLVHANSALAFNNLVRCVIAATFPLYVTDLLEEAGLNVGGSVLGSICLVLSPIAFLFWRFGHTIRRWSKF
ncbi:major facilitator superfamily domain-containing protein, partial [Ilyonectria robusta]|uniref:major facilitator superfamily domain-containing protein n=1 Tax=Ilyonectria robusta TaxID=1079257 RepID=UPI001E8DD02A